MSEQLEEQLYKAKASLALLIEGVEYSDNYGVHGSDFMCCHLCSGGGAPGIPLVHDKDCPVSRVEVAATEWWDEEKIRREELTEAQATISRLTAERDGLWKALELARKWMEMLTKGYTKEFGVDAYDKAIEGIDATLAATSPLPDADGARG